MYNKHEMQVNYVRKRLKLSRIEWFPGKISFCIFIKLARIHQVFALKYKNIIKCSSRTCLDKDVMKK